MTGAAKKAAAPKPKADEAAPKRHKTDTSKAGGHRVVAPLVSVQVSDQVLQFFKGDVLPDGISQDKLDHLTSLGFIAEV